MLKKAFFFILISCLLNSDINYYHKILFNYFGVVNIQIYYRDINFYFFQLFRSTNHFCNQSTFRVSPYIRWVVHAIINADRNWGSKTGMMLESIKCSRISKCKRISRELGARSRICFSRMLERIQYSGKVK